jgi:alpha-tubulin suppressor-like RCC1 family protein
MNIANLTKALQVKLSTATSAADLLVLTKSIQKIQVGVVDTVSTYSDMLALERQPGDLVFVDGEQKLYYKGSASAQWISIIDTSTQAWSWGSAVLGDNTTVAKSSPVSVVGGFTDWIQISSGQTHNAGIRGNGTAWAWGTAAQGRLGDNQTAATRSSPVSVVGGITDWTQISCGRYQNNALRSNGTAWGWGYNLYGGLGDGTIVDKSSPVSTVGGFSDWVQISGGSGHTGAIRATGTAWSWGRNHAGQLGDGTTVNKSSPVSVVGGFTDWTQITNSKRTGRHTLGLRSNGTIWAWGFNNRGQLGDGTTVNKSSPISVVGGFTDWVQISAGQYHTAAVRANGTAWAWGAATNGILGDNSTVSKSSPVSVIGGFTDWVQLSGGEYHTVGLRTNGTTWAWGSAASGRLGDGTTVSKSSPVSVVGGFTDWIQVSASYNTVALR